MKIRILISAILLSVALTANADMRVVSEAHEVALSDLRLPRNHAGTIAFKECDSCDYVMKRVNARTQYRLNGKSVSLEKFRFAVAKIADRNTQPVTVLHHLESDQVAAIAVYL